MKTFRMTADVTFEAESIDDAFARLARHFTEVGNNLDKKIFFTSGEITIKPEPEHSHVLLAKDCSACEGGATLLGYPMPDDLGRPLSEEREVTLDFFGFEKHIRLSTVTRRVRIPVALYPHFPGVRYIEFEQDEDNENLFRLSHVRRTGDCPACAKPDTGTDEPKGERIMSEKIELGSKVKDSVTGAEGTVTVRAEYFSGSVPRVLIEGMSEGKPFELWVEESRCIVQGE